MGNALRGKNQDVTNISRRQDKHKESRFFGGGFSGAFDGRIPRYWAGGRKFYLTHQGESTIFLEALPIGQRAYSFPLET